MEKLSIEEFIKRLEALPLDIREGVLNIDFLSAIREIQTEQKLHIDQGAALENLTFNIILGNIEEVEFMQHLQNDLHSDEEQSIAIASAVNNKVLNPMKKEIQRLQEENGFLYEEDEAAEEEPLIVKPREEDASNLSADDILAGIEDPHPSVGVIHETTSPVKTGPVIKPLPQKPIIAPPPVTPITEEAPPARPATLPNGWPVSTQNMPIPPVAAPIQPTTPSQQGILLKQNLEQAVVSKPTEIQLSVDPYHEPIE